MMEISILLSKIKKVLIFSAFEEKFGRGDTADEILTFEHRAIDYYLCKFQEDPSLFPSIEQNVFYQRIQQQISQIGYLIQEWQQDQ